MNERFARLVIIIPDRWLVYRGFFLCSFWCCTDIHQVDDTHVRDACIGFEGDMSGMGYRKNMTL